MRDFPLRAWIYTATVAGATVAGVMWLARGEPLDLGAALGFGILFILAELAPIAFPNTSYSVSFVLVVASIVAIGPASAAVGASFVALDLAATKRPDWLGRMVFNGAQFALATALAGWAYRASGGTIGSLGASDFPGVFLPLAAMAAVFFVANSVMVTGMVTLVRRTGAREVWHQNFFPVAVSTFAFAVVGVLLGVLYVEMGLWAILFVLLPILVARRALQAAATMDAAYDATLRSLVTAIEAKDAYTRGHAERVSQLASLIAREFGLSAPRVRTLKIAALMHDVGKLVVSTAILTKPGKLTPEEYEHMQTHPVHGCDIVKEIDFLRDGEAVYAVRHHHERMDGRGYPDGLIADDIPLTARIVMVADAFDSMTSTRSYRRALPIEVGLRELRRCSVTQFDPLVIAALDRAIRRYGWEPTPEAFEGELAPRPEVAVHAKHAANA